MVDLVNLYCGRESIKILARELVKGSEFLSLSVYLIKTIATTKFVHLVSKCASTVSFYRKVMTKSPVWHGEAGRCYRPLTARYYSSYVKYCPWDPKVLWIFFIIPHQHFLSRQDGLESAIKHSS